jgi:hypothetical protein
VTDLTSVTQEAFPQAASYSDLQKSLQQEWQFVQRVTKGIGPKFASIKQTLFGNDYNDEYPGHALADLPIKWAGLVIPDSTASAWPNYEESILLCSHILAAF